MKVDPSISTISTFKAFLYHLVLPQPATPGERRGMDGEDTLPADASADILSSSATLAFYLAFSK